KRLKRARVEVRSIDVSKYAGGILHAKYFVVDASESFVGSQNFDWRALTQIQELGVRVRSPEIAASLEDVFETDWALSQANADAKARTRTEHASPITAVDGERLSMFASPKGWLPDEATWDLPRLVATIDGASKNIDVQL